MKKRLFATILAATLIVAQAATVFAAGSKEGGAGLAGDSVGKYEITAELTAQNFPELAASAPEVMAKIEAVNNGEETLQSVADLAPELKPELEGKVMLTKFFDLAPIGDGVKTEDGKYLVSLTVSSLTEQMSEVKLLHYSTVRNVWEIVAPTNVDYTNKEITAAFEDLSPVAVIAKVNATSDSSIGTSPKTGMTSIWMLWMGAALILASGSVLAYRQVRK